ncbi:hypothetical protein AAFF_G00390150 [Aldrovandia affinis]|uniref:Uncharacterized protein n=1 Tax=Aldrovandia affinis TaxID=143900 RepID=A0AAD7SET0_9TELE|nr:hypothetical protein AAFF_G00390150 [Aldrovandia affinis]
MSNGRCLPERRTTMACLRVWGQQWCLRGMNRASHRHALTFRLSLQSWPQPAGGRPGSEALRQAKVACGVRNRRVMALALRRWAEVVLLSFQEDANSPGTKINTHLGLGAGTQDVTWAAPGRLIGQVGSWRDAGGALELDWPDMWGVQEHYRREVTPSPVRSWHRRVVCEGGLGEEGAAVTSRGSQRSGPVLPPCAEVNTGCAKIAGDNLDGGVLRTLSRAGGGYLHTWTPDTDRAYFFRDAWTFFRHLRPAYFFKGHQVT